MISMIFMILMIFMIILIFMDYMIFMILIIELGVQHQNTQTKQESSKGRSAFFGAS